MNIKTEFGFYQKSFIIGRLMAIGFPLVFYVLWGGSYKLALILLLIIEPLFLLFYYFLNLKNTILARTLFILSPFTPEVFLFGTLILFSFDGVFRFESYLSIVLYLIGLIYCHIFFNYEKYEVKMPMYKKSLETNGNFMIWPDFKELDLFGKVYMYGALIPFVPALLMFGIGQAYTDKSIELQYKYIMAGGYTWMFLMMVVFGSHIAFRRAVRVVRKYNLNWD